MANNKNNGDNLSKEDLLFLHLLNNQKYQDNYVVAETITEQGIQNVLQCDLGYISRLLKKNEQQGYIYRITGRIFNKKRKQKVFFLTEDGLKIAFEIKNMSPDIKNANETFFCDYH